MGIISLLLKFILMPEIFSNSIRAIFRFLRAFLSKAEKVRYHLHIAELPSPWPEIFH
jgi:hypothetical protein